MASQMPAEWRDKIAHGRLELGASVLMGGDPPPEHFEQPKGVSVHLAVDSAEEAERVFRALSENATVRMPIAETFWAHRFGLLVDQFGIAWMVSCEKRS